MTTPPDPLSTVPAVRAADDADALVGTWLGNYRVDALLGRGGMGVVYRAWDPRLERAVALKTVLIEGAEARARFMREARLQAKLRHPNVVPVHIVDEQLGTLYLVMDLADEGSLRDLLTREGKLPEARALAIVDALAGALSAAQDRGLIHRDVKPSNVLVDAHGHVLLADFGLAKEIEGPRSNRSAGTPGYAAPEQEADQPLDHRADMYALGVTLYELLTGVRPERDAPPPSAVVPAVSPATDALCARMRAEDREARFPSYDELRAAIAAARAAPPDPAPIVARLLAFVLDFAIVGFGAVGAFHFGVSSAVAFATGASIHDVQVVTIGLAWPAAALAEGAIEARFGTTPGKRLLGLHTIGPRGERPGARRAIARSVVKFFPTFLPGMAVTAGLLPGPRTAVGIVMLALAAAMNLPVLAPRRAPLHDRLAHTRVVVTRRA